MAFWQGLLSWFTPFSAPSALEPPASSEPVTLECSQTHLAPEHCATPPRLHPPLSIFSHSLGASPLHSLPSKLRAAAEAGFTHVEIYQLDLDHHLTASEHLHSELDAAAEIGDLCVRLGLRVVCLQPLRDLPGLACDAERKANRDHAESRFDVMDRLRTDLILCCSSSRPLGELRPFDAQDYAEELGSFADAAKRRGKRVAFEALCWGTTVCTWSQAWEVVRRANRDNLGICLDAFNSLGGEWADPTSPSGCLSSPATRLTALLDSLSALPSSKTYLLQLADALRLDEPLVPSPNPSEPRPARMIWSRSSRLFPCESDRGAYLPLADFVARVIVTTGYNGPWSIEVFNKSLAEEGDRVVADHAARGIRGLRKLIETVEDRLEGKMGCADGEAGAFRRT